MTAPDVWHQPPAGIAAANQVLLSGMLETTVPMWVARHRGRTHGWLTGRAAELVDPVASGADDALHTTRRHGHTASAFSAVAEAAALCWLLGPDSPTITVCGTRISPEWARRWAA